MYVGVICKKEGFRRAGRAWPAGPSVAEVTEEGFEQLKADPAFEVEEISEEHFKAATRKNEVDLSIEDGAKAQTEIKPPKRDEAAASDGGNAPRAAKPKAGDNVGASN